jgi:probable F420-dependent oxidoreductase
MTSTDIGEFTRRAAAIGVAGVAQPELETDPFVLLAVAALADPHVRLSTSVAIMQGRPPMSMARAVRDISQLSGGRFVLGLGNSLPQVVKTSYGAEYTAPGPRLRDYVAALRAIERGWAGGDMRHDGPYYQVSPVYGFAPKGTGQAERYSKIHIQLASLNPYGLRTAGSLCDGLLVHRFSTPDYLRDVMWGNVQDGAADAGRSLDGFETVVLAFTATGADDAEVATQREGIRSQIASYGSIRAYQPVLQHHGLDDIGSRLMAAAEDNLPLAERAAVVPDEVVDLFCVSATHAELPAALVQKYAGIADRLRVHIPVSQVLADVVTAMAAVPGTGRVPSPEAAVIH